MDSGGRGRGKGALAYLTHHIYLYNRLASMLVVEGASYFSQNKAPGGEVLAINILLPLRENIFICSISPFHPASERAALFVLF